MKKKKNNNTEMENFFDVIKRNCDNVPGFKSFLKLSGYFLFFLVFLIIASVGYKDNNKNTTTTTTKVNESLKYGDILNKYLEYSGNFTYKVTLDEKIYQLKGNIKDNIIDGYFENNDGTNHIKIENNQVYLYKFEDAVLNTELLANFNLDYLNPNNLIKLTSGAATISNEESIRTYNYNLDLEELSVKVNNNEIISIVLTGNNYKYELVYN